MSLVDAIPQTIQNIGRARAEGRRATGSIYGQLISEIGQQIGSLPGAMDRRRSQAMQQQMQSLQLLRAQRQAAADEAIENASRQALNPDGSIDANKLTAQLAGTPAASAIPEILSNLQRIQKGAYDLQASKIDAQAAEDDALGAMAHAASKMSNPEDQAAVLAVGIASAVKGGTLAKDRGNALLAELLQDDGNPDPTKVSTAIKRLVAGSGTQRKLAVDEESAASMKSAREAQEEASRAMAEQRSATAKKTETETALANYSAQLAATKSKARYTAVYAGIPPEYRTYFDAPEEWTAQSAERAGFAMMSPAERIKLETEQRIARNASADLALRQRREDRLERGETDGTGTGAKEDPRYKRYRDFVSEYNKTQEERRMRATANGSAVPDYEPAPAFEKWLVMTPYERAKVLREPASRIDDAEMARRAGTAPASPTASPAAPAGSKTVTEAELKTLGGLRAVRGDKTGTTIEELRREAEANGYTVTK